MVQLSEASTPEKSFDKELFGIITETWQKKLYTEYSLIELWIVLTKMFKYRLMLDCQAGDLRQHLNNIYRTFYM